MRSRCIARRTSCEVNTTEPRPTSLRVRRMLGGGGSTALSIVKFDENVR